MNPYQPRTITPLEFFEAKGWRFKIYSILYKDKPLDFALIEAAKETALDFVPQPATTPKHYGVGFVSIHQGQSYDFVTVGYWAFESELKHQTYMRPSSSSAKLETLTANELSMDVWDIKVLAFERDAWLKTVLQASKANLDNYLAEQLNFKG